jgi:hypothetical protein
MSFVLVKPEKITSNNDKNLGWKKYLNFLLKMGQKLLHSVLYPRRVQANIASRVGLHYPSPQTVPF